MAKSGKKYTLNAEKYNNIYSGNTVQAKSFQTLIIIKI